MTEVKFYDFDFNLLRIFRKHISLNATRKFCGYGEFELHMPISEMRLINILKSNEYLLCTYDGGQAVVTGWKIDSDIAVFGKSVEWLMTKRVVSELDRANETFEQTARFVVKQFMGDFVELGAVVGTGTAKSYKSNKPRTVYDVVSELLAEEELGFRLWANVDAKSFMFEAYKGSDRNVLLSQSGKTAHDTRYIKELDEKMTGGVWYEKKTLTADGTETTVWTHTADGSQIGAKKWCGVLSGVKTDEEAVSEANRKRAKEWIECETRRVEYRKDYWLGDTIRLQFEYGDFKACVKRCVAEVEIYSEGGCFGARPILKTN